MKRSFSMALILALLGTTVISPACAEEAEIIVEEAETMVVEEFPAEGLDLSLYSEEISPEDLSGEMIAEGSAESGPAMASDEAPAEETQAEESADAVEGNGSQSATGIQLNASSVSIGVKEKYEGLAVIVTPEGSALPSVSWRSSNSKVAKIDSKSGVITGVKKGNATVYAKMEGSNDEVACKINVKDAPKKVTVEPASLNLSVGSTYQLKAAVPSGYASGKLTYSSNKKRIVSVNESGVVTALAEGSATVTVKTYNGKKATCKIKVVGEPVSLEFPDSIIPVAINEKTTLTVTGTSAKGESFPLTAVYAIDQNSPDPGCITLNPETGEVSGVREGQAIVSATAGNGITARCVVEVDILPASLHLNMSSVTIGVKEVYVGVIAEAVAPAGHATCSQSVTWSTSNSKIAEVDASTGAITGIKKGSCTIKATTPNGKTAKCKVTVLKAPTKKTISISPANGSLKVGESGKYKITFSSGYGGSLIYESSDTGVATVDNTGIVTAVAPGNCKIKVTTYNKVTVTAKLEVISNGTSGGDGAGKSVHEEEIQTVLQAAQSKLGKPYVYGAFGPNSFDCAGFVYWCYKQVGITLKDSAYKQGYDSTYEKISYDNLRPGDLVFFNTVKDKDLSDHSGIYLGNGSFIHASSSGKKVMISKMSSGYYKRNFSWGRRILD